MTNEERVLSDKCAAGGGGAASVGFGGRVPATQQALPPIDPEANQFIQQQFQTHPEAQYRITQMAVVQEAALAEAANRIQRLQAELQQTRQAPQAQPAQSRGFLGGLFGGGQQNAPAQQPVWNQGGQPGYPQAGMAPPQYPPNTQPGMFQRSGSGFLGSALTTAAGVAGGVVAGNALMDMFSGHGGMGGGFGGGMGGGFGGMPGVPEETTVINNYGDAGQGGPGWDNSTQGGDASGGDAGWDNSSQGGDAGGWDNSGGGGFDDNSL